MIKKFILTLLFAAFILTAAPKAQAADVSIYIDGERLGSSFISGLNTMAPLRAVSEVLAPGCRISWDGASNTARVRAAGLSITARSGSPYIVANGRCIWVGENSFIRDGVFMLPIRALAMAFGAEVEWNEARRSAEILSGSGSIESGADYYDPDAVYWLARIISAEAQGEPLLGQIAVGNVVMNRVASPEYPDSIYGVIFDRNGGVQFTPVANGTIYDEPTESAVLAAKLVLDGADAVGDSMFFLNPELATSFWITENRSYHSTIGKHWFYV